MLSTKAGKIVSSEVQFDMKTKLDLISEHAKRDKKFKFTSLAHLLNEGTLKECFHMLKKGKATGIDHITYEEYEKYLNTNIQKLVKKMKEGKYYPQPVRRVYIPKGEGKVRPLGIPAMEDKVVQLGISRVLNAIYEQDFLDCSYGYRQGKGCHKALKQIDNSIMTKQANHIIDADILGFFNNVDHEWIMRMLQERIADKNLLRMIKKFLKAGVMEDGVINATNEGTPQGGIISPILSNIYLHYALDLWIEKQIKRDIKGYIEIVRYCDDFIIMVQYKEEADNILKMLEERLNKFGLDLSKEKTKLIEFGKFARINAENNNKKPATFNFLGFTHYSDKKRNGKFKVGRKTDGKKLRTKLKEMNEWLKKTVNKMELKEWWPKLCAKLRGHYEYYGVSGNYENILSYYYFVCKLVYKRINKRSQKRSMNWEQFRMYLKEFPLPLPRIKHNFYALRSDVQ